MSVHRPIFGKLLSRLTTTVVVDDQRSWKGFHVLGGAFHLARLIERVSRSRTVGLLLPTGGAFPVCGLGAWAAGRTIVPLNYLLKREELQYVVDDCETDVVITVGPMLEFLGHEPRVRTIVRLDEEAKRFGKIPPVRWPAEAADDDLAVLLYTSGTSGKPKGVMLTHGNVSANMRQCIEWAGFRGDDVVLGVLPQFHSFGFTVLTWLPLSHGCKVVYSAKFIPQHILKLIRAHRPTAFVGIPSMFRALLHLKSATAEDFRSFRYVVSGGEPLPDAVAGEFRDRFGVTINEGYGLTETSPVTNWCLPSEYVPKSVGRAITDVRERIVDLDTGRTLGSNRDGEVRIKGPNVMKGYFKLPEETARAFDEEGWFRTGDIGRFDDAGHLFITGRLKEMMIVGGENVFPREIEEVLNAHPAVGASAVVGVTDPLRGELPVAFVEMKDGEAFDETSLRTWCRERLAGYKVPRDIRHIERLPRNPTGKIMRRELKGLAGAQVFGG
ncbi:MAG: AMP-binding protein [Phycisphaerales bacterium]|nr:AMP-binding protein [Phycisphaerales bacterium]